MSWAKFCPQTHQSAGKTKRKGRGKGNPWLGGTLGRIVSCLSRTDTFLGTRYRRLAKRRGKQKAIVALGNSVLTVVYHLLADPEARFDDLGPGFYESRINTNRRARNLATQLQAITGQKIVIRDERRSSPNPLPDNNIRDTGHLGLHPPSPGCVVTWPCYRGFSGQESWCSVR